MANKTANYQLNQWEPEDNFLRTDFNEDNAKIEAALNSLAAAMPKFVVGSYVGTGTYGERNPNQLDFAATLGRLPKLLYITADNGSYNMLLTPGLTTQSSNNSYANTIQWTNTGLSWYCISNKNGQMNNESIVYLYVAIG